MSRQERYGDRDLTFSAWHRTLSNDCTAIDVDFLEYCRYCRTPLALIEIARDVGQETKPTSVLAKLGERADVPVYCVLYTASDGRVVAARMRRVQPSPTKFRSMSEQDLRATITRFHDRCSCRLAEAA